MIGLKSMTTTELTGALLKSGYEFDLAGGKLRVRRDGGLPGDVREALQKNKPAIIRCLPAVLIQRMDRPPTWPADRWQALKQDAAAFVESSWAETSWQDWEIWGCHRDAPFHRIDTLGLIGISNGKEVVDMDDSAATFTDGLRYYRKQRRPHSCVMLWEIEP